MLLLFFLLWILLNGRCTVEIALIGAALSLLLFAFICRFMKYSFRRDILLLRRLFMLLRYCVTLLFEIIKANMDVMHMILSGKYDVEPQLITISTELKTEWARVILANSITLTPGTITVSLIGDQYKIHCLDRTLADGIDSSVFVKLLKQMEEIT